MRKVYYDMLLGKLRDKTGDSDEAGVSSVNGLSGDIQLLGPEGEALPVSGQNITGIATKQYVDSKPGVPGPEGPQGEPGPAGPEGPQGPQGNFEDEVISRPAAEFTVADPEWGVSIYLNDVMSVMTLAEPVCGVSHVQFSIVSADPAVTGTIILIPVLDGEEQLPVLLQVGASPGIVHFACPATGKLAFRRDCSSVNDTLKNGDDTVTAVILDWELQRKNRFLEAAKDPSCIMALSSDNGGSWYSRLRSGVVWPDTSPWEMTNVKWTSFSPVAQSIGTDDFECEVEFTVFRYTAHHAIFGVGTATMNIRQSWSSTATDRLQIGKDNLIAGQSGMILVGTLNGDNEKNHFVLRRSGGRALCILNGVETLLGEGESLPFNATNADGHPLWTESSAFIHSARLTNLTTEKRLWEYPNEAERAGLIRKNNIATVNGVLAPVTDDNLPTYVQTPIDFQGTAENFTLMTKVLVKRKDIISVPHDIIGQGYWHNGQLVASITLWMNTTTGNAYFQFGLGTLLESGARKDVATSAVVTTIDEFYQLYADRPVSLAAVADWERRTMALYVDGQPPRTAVIPADAIHIRDYRSIDDAASRPLSLFRNNYRHGGGVNHRMFGIYHALVFDRALSAGEIAEFQ